MATAASDRTGHGQHDEIRVARRLRGRQAVAVDGATLLGDPQILLASAVADGLTDEPASAGGKTERAADQADAGDDHAIEELGHFGRGLARLDGSTRAGRSRGHRARELSLRQRPFQRIDESSVLFSGADRHAHVLRKSVASDRPHDDSATKQAARTPRRRRRLAPVRSSLGSARSARPSRVNSRSRKAIPSRLTRRLRSTCSSSSSAASAAT